MAEATKLRHGEKAKNTQTIADSQEAQTAVAQALTVLKEFYAKAGEATALLQQQPKAPEIFDSPYRGMQSENGGVIGMLEVIESDFARLEADTKAAEATFMTDWHWHTCWDLALPPKTATKQDEEQGLAAKRMRVEGDLQLLQQQLRVLAQRVGVLEEDMETLMVERQLTGRMHLLQEGFRGA